MTNQTLALTLGEAAQELRVSANTLTSWVKMGRVPYIRIGRKYLFSREELSEWLKNGKPPGAKTT